MRLILFFVFFFLSSVGTSFAIYDPLSKPNNIFGIHILFPDEIFEARNLINSQGGDWGYVTIPIQSSDRDLVKWQKFMDDAKTNHLIPVIRLSTTGDYFDTSVWEKPRLTDIVDFANFLNSLNWPIENRYVIVYNEVNRGDEWGGSVNPFEYAEILDFAVVRFKEVNPNFFIISAGLDNAAPNRFPTYMNHLDFLEAMSYEVPSIFEKIDGLASHSYPNPGFSQPPGQRGTRSFSIESSLVRNISGKNLPIFITETGWSNEVIHPDQIAKYMEQSFRTDWDASNIVAVTPFLLRAGEGPFSKFSFLLPNGGASPQYKTMTNIVKLKGEPQVSQVTDSPQNSKQTRPSKSFDREKSSPDITARLKKVGVIFKWLLGF